MRPRSLLLILLPALLIGFGLRVYQLSAQGLWGDEAMSTHIAALPFTQAVSPGLDTHPPLFYALLQPWSRVAGFNLFTLRFLPLILSMPMIALAFLAGAWLFNRLTGVIAAWLMATAPLQVYYAQELRMYSAAALFALGSTVCLIALLQGRRGAGWWIGYALTTLLGVYTHYQVFYILPAHAIAVLLIWRRRARESSISDFSKPIAQLYRLTPGAWFGVMIVIGLAYVPWVVEQAGYLLSHSSRRIRVWQLADLWNIAIRGGISYAAGLTLPQGQAVVLALWSALAGFGLVWALRSRRVLVLILVGIGTVSVLGCGWIVNPFMPFFHERFVLVGASMLLIAVAGGIATLWQARSALGWLALAAVLAVNAIALGHWYFDPQYQKSDYDRAIAEIAAQAQSGDIIVLNNTEQLALFEFYTPPAIPSAALSNDDVFTAERANARLSQVIQGHDRAWLINYGDPAVYDPYHRAEQWLAAHGYRTLFKSYRDLELSLYVVSSASLPQAPSIPLTVKFADGIRLTGLDIQPQPVHPGGTLLITLFWQADRVPQGRYTVFCHLIDAQGRLVAQFDGEPAGGSAPTTSWKPGTMIVDRRAIAIPADMSAGTLTLRAGMYTWPDLIRLPILAAPGKVVEQAVELAAVHVR